MRSVAMNAERARMTHRLHMGIEPLIRRMLQILAVILAFTLRYFPPLPSP